MTQADHLAPVRAAILAAALKEAPFGGWSVDTLRRAADEAGVERGLQRLAFPRGVVDLLAYYSESADEAMRARLAETDLSSLKIRERIALGVRLRLEALLPHKAAAQRAAQLLALPIHAATGAEFVARTADAIWRAIGDTSTDFNFYSKRALLSAVYGATLLKFLGDDSEGHAETYAFLARRIDDVMKIEKAKGTVKKALSGVPSPLDLLARLRYGPSTRR